MTPWIENLKYDRPVVWTLCVFFSIVVGLLSVFMVLPDSSFTRAAGIVEAQRRISAFGSSIYWGSRAAANASASSRTQPVTAYGTIVGFGKKQDLIVTVPEGTQFVEHSFQLADVTIRDPLGAAMTINSLRGEDVKLDVYQDQAVAWVRGTPLNLHLVEKGVADPESSPPTDIVDRVFATHYWQIACGNKPAN